MRSFVAALMMITFAGVVHADEKPLVVVELFTSEGCSSCPAADALLTKMTESDDVLALALHVDYWDYLGWKDEFAQAKFTKRQERYNTVLKSRFRLVTPQMFFHGRESVAGAKQKHITELLAKHRGTSDVVLLDVKKNAQEYRVSINPRGVAISNADVFIVQYLPNQVSKVRAGENKGRTLTHTNVVTSWDRVGEWSGQRDWRINHTIADDDVHAAVIVQMAGNGPILAAKRLSPLD